MLRLLARLLGLIRTARLTWRLLIDGRVPMSTKLIPLGLVLYVLSPRDIVPDLLPVLGRVDDLTVLWLGLLLFLRICPRQIVREHEEILSGRVIEGEYRVVGANDER